MRRTSLAGMCGRYASSRQPEDLVEEFEITLVPDTLVAAGTTGPRYAWIDPAEKIGVRVWYLRVLD